MSDPEFDPDIPFGEHRVFGGQSTLRQGGHEFSLRHKYLGQDPDWVEPVVEEEVIEPPPDDGTGKAGVLARAHQKLAGYSAPEDLSDVKRENNKALAAERLA